MRLVKINRPTSLGAYQNNDGFFSLQGQINRLFDDFFNDDSASNLPGSNAYIPAIDVLENKDSFTVTVELPGMEAKDVDLSVTDNYLTITGQRKETKEEKQGNYITRECSCGSFQRNFALPDIANTDAIEASFKKGLLNITIPKHQETIDKKKKVTIQNKD